MGVWFKRATTTGKPVLEVRKRGSEVPQKWRFIRRVLANGS